VSVDFPRISVTFRLANAVLNGAPKVGHERPQGVDRVDGAVESLLSNKVIAKEEEIVDGFGHLEFIIISGFGYAMRLHPDFEPGLQRCMEN
jgi:hypothetical protein